MSERRAVFFEDFRTNRRPTYLLPIAAVCLAGAVVFSTRFFPDLGPAPEMLVHIDPAKRRAAEVTVREIFLGRCLLVAIGVALATVWLFWEEWNRTPWIRRIAAHSPTMPAAGPALNRSLAIMLAAVTVSLIWVALGSRYPELLMPRWVAKEDGVVEYATAFMFLACAPLSARLAMRAGERRRQLMHGLMAAVFVLCFLEEISWGQRLFGVETPELLQTLNAQHEINLHNSFGYAADHIFMIVVFGYGAVLPFATRFSPLLYRTADMLGLPIASLGLAIGFAVVSGMHDWTVYVVLDKAPVRAAEVREFLTSLGFLLLMLEALRRQRTYGIARGGLRPSPE